MMNNFKINLHSLNSVLLIFLLLYMPFLRVGGISIPMPYVYTFIFSLISIYILIFKTFSKQYLVFFGLFLFGYIWTFLISFINSQFDFDILTGYLTGTLSILASYSIVHILFFKKEAGFFLIKAVYLSGLIHAFIMILSFFIAPFRNILYSFVALGTKGEGFVEKMIRSPGLTTGGGDALSLIQSISLIFGIYYFFEIKGKMKNSEIIKYTISFFILIFSIFLSARTGLIIFLLFILVYSLKKSLRVIESQIVKISTFKKFVISSMLIISVLGISFSFLKNSSYNRFVNRAFELFINYSESGELGTTSTNRLQEMYFLPDSDLHILFGDGNFGRDKKLTKLSTDVGYIRIVFGAGVIGIIFMFAPLIYLTYKVLSNYHKHSHYSFLIMFIVISILIVNFKVFHYFQFRESFKVLFLMFSFISIKK